MKKDCKNCLFIHPTSHNFEVACRYCDNGSHWKKKPGRIKKLLKLIFK